MQHTMSLRAGVAQRPAQRQLSRAARQGRVMPVVRAQATTLVAPPAKGDLVTADPQQAELSIK